MSQKVCSRHPDAGVRIMTGVGAGWECVECRARICQGCGKNAPESWMSARCHDCYRAFMAEERQRKDAERASHYTEFYGMRDAIAKARRIREHHLHGTPPGMEDKCQCVGCEMGRALDGEPLLNPQPASVTPSEVGWVR